MGQVRRKFVFKGYSLRAFTAQLLILRRMVGVWLLSNRLLRKATAARNSALLCILVLEVTAVPVMAGSLRFERMMTESGGSVAEANAIIQDRNGFIWIGGSNGLARYDTHEFQLFHNDPKDSASLSNNFVWDVLEDRDGDLWVATTNGLNRFDPETETFIRYLNVAGDPESLVSNDVYTLHEDTTGYLWVGTRGGLSRYDKTQGEFSHFRHDPADPNSLSDSAVTAIFQDAQGVLWFGTRRGLNIYRPGTQTFELFYIEDSELYDPRTITRDLAEDAAGDLWVATDIGLYRFNDQRQEVEHYQKDPEDDRSLSDNRTWRLTVDSQDQLWIATDHGGLNLYRHESNDFIHYRHDPFNPVSLSSDQVRLLFEDNAGDYWVALFPSGVDYANSASAAFNVHRHDPKRNSLNHDAILSVASGPDDKLWVGSEGGLNLFDPVTNEFTSFKSDADQPGSLSANAVLAIEEDQQGRYWFGTWSGGLNLYQPDTGTFRHFLPDPDDKDSISSAYIWSLLSDSNGFLWIGTEDEGLNRYDPKTGVFEHFLPDPDNPQSLSGSFMRSVVEDHQGTIWIATLQGLNRFNADSQTFSHFKYRDGDPSSIPHNSVATLFEDSSNRLWVGTESGLALLVDREQGTFRSYNTDSGLPSNAIMGIAEDGQGYLWINTLRGLSRFDPEQESFSNFTNANGLAGNIMNRPALHYSQNNRMYVGSTKGLTEFNPANIKSNTLIPPVHFTGLRIFNQTVEIGDNGILPKPVGLMDTLVLNYQQNMFALEFAALNYRDSDANQYAYRMQGFDDQWISAGSANSATYTNLNPGKYRFTVKGSNNNGVWNEEGRFIDIVILPPPWRTWWAYCLYMLCFLGVGYAFVRSERRKVRFEQQNVAHLRAIDKMKDEFLANTSHELRTPLNGIIGLTESLIDESNEKHSERTLTYLKMIASSGRRLSNLINDILDFSKIKNNGLSLNLAPVHFQAVSESVCTMTAPLAEKKGLHLINELPDDLPAVLADEDRLQQVLYNLIGNAIKFTFSGHVRLSAHYDSEALVVSVEDTGIGISEADLDRIFESFTQGHGGAARESEGTGLGLTVVKNLIEAHGGSIDVESRLNKGSTFRFRLPLADPNLPVTTRGNEVSERLNVIVNDYLDTDSEALVTDSPNEGAYPFHILVVDDDPINREVLIGQLSLHNYRISEASSGPEAVSSIERDQSIDLVLLDVMMPRMTGYETATQIRALKPVHELPIIFITAKHLASDLVAGFVSGGNDFLIKPVSKNELLSRVKTHLLLLDVTRNLEGIVEERTTALKETQKALVAVDNIVDLINRQSSMEGLAQILLEESAGLLGTRSAGAFWLLDDDSRRFVLIAIHGEQKALSYFPISIAKEEIVQLNMRNELQRGVQVVRVDQIKFVAHAEKMMDSALVMAIETSGELTGLLVFVNPKGAGSFSAAEQETFSRLETHAVSAVSKAKMLEALKRQNQKLEKTSFSDQLTGLSNRHHLLQYLPGDLALSRRKYEMSIESGLPPLDADILFILVDIDHFKPVNDTYGHSAGDLILQQFARLLKSVFRESDHIVRWGGEEFLVVVRFFDRSQARDLVERFRHKVSNTEFDIGCSEKKLSITCSVGYSCFPFYREAPHDYSWEQVIETADKCLYAAKRSSRNASVGVFGSDNKSAEGGVIEDLPEAIRLGRACLHTSLEEGQPLTWE